MILWWVHKKYFEKKESQFVIVDKDSVEDETLNWIYLSFLS